MTESEVSSELGIVIGGEPAFSGHLRTSDGLLPSRGQTEEHFFPNSETGGCAGLTPMVCWYCPGPRF